MYKAQEFRAFFQNVVGAAQSSCNTYNSYLKRIDETVGGLDEKIARDGVEAVLEWSRTTREGPFENYPDHARAVLKRYIQFLIDERVPTIADDPALPETSVDDPTGLAFKLEKEMQVAVRKQLANLEPGLSEEDGGSELSVGTGRIDILAKDTSGRLVVIELKAGVCPAGALEQVLGYAQSLAEERPGNDVRAILIASAFPDRIRAAAKRTTALELVTYEFSLQFHAVP